MRLHYSPTSPFARKCQVCAQELGLRERIELVPAAAHPVTRDRALVELNPLGEPFNPEFHEAMAMQPSAEQPPNSVAQVVQKGYQLNGRLLRPARVIVTREP